MAWQRVASFSEIDVDGVLGVDVNGSPVALYRLSNEVFATSGICTHALALLSDGFVEDGRIECPLHQGQFDIRSGKALCAPVTEDLRTYAVKLEGDDVFIDMERPGASAPAVANAAPNRKAGDGVRVAEEGDQAGIGKIASMNVDPELSLTKRYAWPAEGLTRIPDWVYTDQTIYEREIERIFHGRTWNYVALECEVPKVGDFIRSNVGPTPVVVVRADDGSINVVENRCSHRAAEFCRELNAGRAGPDDRDLQLLGAQRSGLGIGAKQRIHEPPMKPSRLRGSLECNRILLHAGRAEVVREAPDRHDERVVTKGPQRCDLLSTLVDERRDKHFSLSPVEPDHLAYPMPESMPVRLRKIVSHV